MIVLKLLISYLLIVISLAANKDQWRDKAIYQIITDRFWRTDGSI
jgi:hypothetical protein